MAEPLRQANARPARADIRLELQSPSPAQLAIKALYENRLGTDVKAGENRGVTLRHDYVVRDCFGPLEVNGTAEFRRTLALQRDWKPKDLGLAAFVQDGAGREVLRASALANCGQG